MRNWCCGVVRTNQLMAVHFWFWTWYPPPENSGFETPNMKFWWKDDIPLTKRWQSQVPAVHFPGCNLLCLCHSCSTTKGKIGPMEFQGYTINQTFEKWDDMMLVFLTTVDGKNIAPVDSLSYYLQGFVHPRCRISSINGMTFSDWLDDLQVAEGESGSQAPFFGRHTGVTSDVTWDMGKT